MSVAAVATRFRSKPIFADFAFWGWSIIAYCLLPVAYAWLDAFGGLDAYCLGMHTASECILPPNAYCL